MTSSSRLGWCLALSVSLFLSSSALAAEVSGLPPGLNAGDVIGPEKANLVKDLVSPGVLFRVTHGMTMKISPTSRIDWPPPYKDATEKYSGQVRLAEDKHSLVGYVAG